MIIHSIFFLVNLIGFLVGYIFFSVSFLWLILIFVFFTLLWVFLFFYAKKKEKNTSRYYQYLEKEFFQSKIRALHQKNPSLYLLIEDIFDLAIKILEKEEDYRTTLEYTVFQTISLSNKMIELDDLLREDSLGKANLSKIKNTLNKMEENLKETKENLATILTNLSLEETQYSKININKELSFLNKALEETIREEENIYEKN